MWQSHAPTYKKWHKKGKKEYEYEGDIPHVDTWRNARVWVDFLGGLHS